MEEIWRDKNGNKYTLARYVPEIVKIVYLGDIRLTREENKN